MLFGSREKESCVKQKQVFEDLCQCCESVSALLLLILATFMTLIFKSVLIHYQSE